MERRQSPTQSPPRNAADPRYERDASAVEVIALFDGAIVDARHFDDPHAGERKRSTTAQLAGGGAALGIALLLFVVAFARGGGHALDVLAALLVAGGLTALIRGLFARHEERRPRDYTVGTGTGALLPIAAGNLDEPVHPLLRSTGSGYELLVTPSMSGEILAFGRTLPLGEAARVAEESHVVGGARAIPFVEGMKSRINVGGATIHLRSVPAPRRQPVPLRLDLASLRYTGGVFAAAALFLMMIFAIPPDASALSLDGLGRNERFAKLLIIPPKVEEPKTPPVIAKKEDKGARGSRGHKGESGVAGKRNAPKTNSRWAIKGPADNKNIQLQKEMARELAQSTGVIGLMRRDPNAMSSIFSNTSALGDAAESVMGNLIGNQVGESGGVEGVGLVGAGRYGGGSGTTIGWGGKLDRIGGGDCQGPDCKVYGDTRKVAALRTHGVQKIVTLGQVERVVGGLDKEIIRRVIRQHAAEVKFCYEQALVKNPDLYGKVVVKFAINPNGRVATAAPAEVTVGYDVGMCVSGVVGRMEFPKPMGGGMVMVNYPFAFRAASSSQ